MNELKSLETQLHSWNPRRPSAELERRLFPAKQPCPACQPAQVFWHRLAPALGCLLLTIIVTLDQGVAPPHRSATDLAHYYVQAASSNQAWISYRMPLNLEHNVFVHFPRPTFDWTNQSPFPSTTGSFGLLKTNNL